MAGATYRIGPSDFFTPADLQADAQQLDAQVDILDPQIDELDAPELVDQWNGWHGRWKAFADDHFGGWFSSFLSSWNNANRDELIAFERQFEDFSSQAHALGTSLVAPIGPSSGAKDTFADHLNKQTKGIEILPSTTGLVAVAVAVVVLILVWQAYK